jgi:hypothetical protein
VRGKPRSVTGEVQSSDQSEFRDREGGTNFLRGIHALWNPSLLYKREGGGKREKGRGRESIKNENTRDKSRCNGFQERKWANSQVKLHTGKENTQHTQPTDLHQLFHVAHWVLQCLTQAFDPRMGETSTIQIQMFQLRIMNNSP